jgi:hypothetical protein
MSDQAAYDVLPHDHELKCLPQFFGSVYSRTKNFEIRKNDRNFKFGDVLYLREWDPATQQYTGPSCYRNVIYMTDFPAGLREGYVVLGLS